MSDAAHVDVALHQDVPVHSAPLRGAPRIPYEVKGDGPVDVRPVADGDDGMVQAACAAIGIVVKGPVVHTGRVGVKPLPGGVDCDADDVALERAQKERFVAGGDAQDLLDGDVLSALLSQRCVAVDIVPRPDGRRVRRFGAHAARLVDGPEDVDGPTPLAPGVVLLTNGALCGLLDAQLSEGARLLVIGGFQDARGALGPARTALPLIADVGDARLQEPVARRDDSVVRGHTFIGRECIVRLGTRAFVPKADARPALFRREVVQRFDFGGVRRARVRIVSRDGCGVDAKHVAPVEEFASGFGGAAVLGLKRLVLWYARATAVLV